MPPEEPHPVSLATAADLEAEGERAFLKRARTLATCLYQLVKVAQMHDLDNEVVQEPLGNVVRAVSEAAAPGQPISLQIYEDSWFANHKLLKFTPKTFLLMRDFAEWMKKRGIGKVTFAGVLEGDHLKAFLKGFLGSERGDPEVVGRSIRAGLPEPVREAIRLSTLKEIENESARVTIQTDERSFAVLLYAKILTLLREAYAGAARGELAPVLLGKIQRSTQELVQLSERDPERLQSLLAVRGEGDYLPHHALHVAILSILVGARAGIDRARLSELGSAALLAFAGRAMVPAEILSRAGPLSPADRKALERHPLSAARLFLGGRRVTESLLTRLVVAFEHPLQANGYPRTRFARPPHLYARIVGLADAYDALVSPRPWRPGYRPDEALRMILEGAGTRYDDFLVRTLVNLLGRYPLGTLVVLSSGERAVVIHNHPEAGKRDRPVVKVVLDAKGRRVAGKAADLAESPGLRIVRTDDPQRYNLNVMAVFLE